ncbi:DNA methyltransferase, partial [Achromatium sp. WMS1]
LLKTYDKIYTIDLHGNSKKKETAPDGSKDENVFDIQQGVSINIFVKTGNKKPNELGQVFHFDVYGKREFKYAFLTENTIKSINFNKLPNIAPNYFMVQKDFAAQKKYDLGFQVNELFLINGVGLTTAHDEFVIKETCNDLLNYFKKFQVAKRDENHLHQEFNVRKKKGWNILEGYDNIRNEADLNKYIEPISYRPFDSRYVFYEDKLVWRTVRQVMQHFLKGENVGITLCKQFKTGDNYVHTFITNKIIESSYVSNRTSEITSTFPIYLYPETTGQQTLEQNTAERTPNLNTKIVKQIADKLSLTFTDEKEATKNTFAPIDILDYIYAVLHSPTYRQKYKEFLKIDFPRVPYPQDQNTFWKLVKLGSELR